MSPRTLKDFSAVYAGMFERKKITIRVIVTIRNKKVFLFHFDRLTDPMVVYYIYCFNSRKRSFYVFSYNIIRHLIKFRIFLRDLLTTHCVKCSFYPNEFFLSQG